MSLQIITTADGSHSLLNTELNETYHSVHGAIRESQYVFIEQGLDFWLSKHPERDVRILEVGFGTGLNTLLSVLYSANKNNHFFYESWEAFPLGADVIERLNYAEQLPAVDYFQKLHSSKWDLKVELTHHFSLLKRKANILTETFNHEHVFDLIYYDAFAPSKQPEIWAYDALKRVTTALTNNGVFVTYCAKGQVKRDLRTLGLHVETLPGPPGKKEMVRAVREH
ncbi:MAG: tRNA (5-methylaminomethyl-2-thiouridine)(34)-methyltransferase MnmD [Cyclobacteriaceae bacterium]|nr:tRNA (5-methylaminomethyl-2-thiouridine)(34)-methyltransferase MnmD [Cyclobacteriaceae bacterium]